ncbi:RagB/SusD family nutrient uptake outer membrane protein [Chitinophaga oryziterrae]|uniref:RagB/SusD family nutrient uptake outer membrane protein n=1 Tax=Chitinophaga oryziterrae TaxID=1031224 RepID=A0A6N8JFG7_9BACT|nr:RagB/SusD family nutrient uptake outer membrane protein [Chitinophaga oryziterrae]MVT43069.1 RagB/SusD family nutrient uptake outer membrane protein [Chitinophaga oryziterrae]
MTRIIYTYIACLLLLGSTGCRKYVEIEQQGKRTLHYTTDYQYLLNNTSDIEPSYYYPVVASDDYGPADDGFLNRLGSAEANTFIWAADFFGDNADPDWDRMYKQMYVFNQVTTGVMNSDGGSDADKRTILAEGQVHRAFTYFSLVNIYAKQYDAATAATDAGVPLILNPDFTSSLVRVSVKTIYDQINSDLTQAIPNLPDISALAYNPSKTAAYAILARASLQKGEYADAEKYADSALTRQSALVNLNDYIASPVSYPTKYKDPEMIFTKSLSVSSVTLPLSASLLSLFDAHDLRYELFTTDGSTFTFNSFAGRGYYRPRLNSDNPLTGPTTAEMMLIKAEAEARVGSYTAAVDILNTIRQKRFRPADYIALSAANAAEALQLVINERRRELLCRGLRWFDQKRLNKEAAFAATVTRVYKGGTYTLEPNSNRYVFPIPAKNILLNPEITQNPR